jgi:hypothetical protein
MNYEEPSMSARPSPHVPRKHAREPDLCPLCAQPIPDVSTPAANAGNPEATLKEDTSALLWPQAHVTFRTPSVEPEKPPEPEIITPVVKPCVECGAETIYDPYRRRMSGGEYLCEGCQLEEWDGAIRLRLRVRAWAMRVGFAALLTAIAGSAVLGAKLVTDMSKRVPSGIIRK